MSIEVQQVAVAESGRHILRDVSVTFTRGEVCTLLGPNGAGKSLLLRCLHGLIAPDRGQVMLGGQTLQAEHKARQAMVFQRPVLLRRSVAANLEFVLKRQRLCRSVRKQRIAELLEEGGLQDKSRQAARSLSSVFYLWLFVT